ncbi:MAG: site-2 protease family protein [Gemmatimonadaceae bacterium]|nr:site-2 protease family protein [Gemmatimonadaceae bacterium]
MERLDQLILVAPMLLFSMVAHEYAHGYAAMKQGDLTAYSLGRLTWNPLKHIDPFMTVLLPTFLALIGAPIFGGAKPVPVNPRNYRHYKRGDIIVSLAGVVVNFGIAIACTLLILPVGLLGRQLPQAQVPLAVLQLMLQGGIIVNLVLAIFNLLPIPPLDGSRVFKYVLPPAWALKYEQIGAFGLLILMALLSFGRPLLSVWFAPLTYVLDAARRFYAPYMLPNPFA